MWMDLKDNGKCNGTGSFSTDLFWPMEGLPHTLRGGMCHKLTGLAYVTPILDEWFKGSAIDYPDHAWRNKETFLPNQLFEILKKSFLNVKSIELVSSEEETSILPHVWAPQGWVLVSCGPMFTMFFLKPRMSPSHTWRETIEDASFLATAPSTFSQSLVKRILLKPPCKCDRDGTEWTSLLPVVAVASADPWAGCMGESGEERESCLWWVGGCCCKGTAFH